MKSRTTRNGASVAHTRRRPKTATWALAKLSDFAFVPSVHNVQRFPHAFSLITTPRNFNQERSAQHRAASFRVPERLAVVEGITSDHQNEGNSISPSTQGHVCHTSLDICDPYDLSLLHSKKLQFCILSNQDAVKISEFEVTHRDLYTPTDRLPVKNGVLDRRLVRLAYHVRVNV